MVKVEKNGTKTKNQNLKGMATSSKNGGDEEEIGLLPLTKEVEADSVTKPSDNEGVESDAPEDKKEGKEGKPKTSSVNGKWEISGQRRPGPKSKTKPKEVAKMSTGGRPKPSQPDPKEADEEDDNNESEYEEESKKKEANVTSRNQRKAAPASMKKGTKRTVPTTGKLSKKVKKEESEDEEKDYEVEKIVNVRFKKSGRREFEIQWKGYAPSDTTWEPEDNLECQEALDAFAARVGAKLKNG